MGQTKQPNASKKCIVGVPEERQVERTVFEKLMAEIFGNINFIN